MRTHNTPGIPPWHSLMFESPAHPSDPLCKWPCTFSRLVTSFIADDECLIITTCLIITSCLIISTCLIITTEQYKSMLSMLSYMKANTMCRCRYVAPTPLSLGLQPLLWAVTLLTTRWAATDLQGLLLQLHSVEFCLVFQVCVRWRV